MFTHEGKQWPAAMASCEQRALGTRVCVCVEMVFREYQLLVGTAQIFQEVKNPEAFFPPPAAHENLSDNLCRSFLNV